VKAKGIKETGELHAANLEIKGSCRSRQSTQGCGREGTNAAMSAVVNDANKNLAGVTLASIKTCVALTL
jgi:hypothetical protein